MKFVNPNIYDKKYYYNTCLGSEEFKKSGGKKLHRYWKNLLKNLTISKTTKILDVGCGRGDIALYLAKKANHVIGIDYSKDAISIANKIKNNFNKSIREKVQFKVMNIKKMSFPDNYFDLVICIDVLEHLYKDEVEKALEEITRVLKKDGVFFIQTGHNKILYDITYPIYTLPMNKLLTKFDQSITKKKYKSLPNDPRIPEEKIQHVNEPTYFYLKQLFKKHRFEGKLIMQIGFLKVPIKGWRTSLYDFLIALYPVSTLFPLNILFAHNFSGAFKNKK